ncbi:MAG: YihY/virulence factor BrkB family protein [Anaerolineae bacterium]|nr:YihY/virulence factor BrkB family protein [Anaerolineae bacterium]
MKSIIEFAKKLFAEFSGDGVPRMAAALAYYTIFSMAPLIVIAISIGGLILGREAAQGQLMGEIEGAVGRESAALIQSMVAKMDTPGTSLVSALLGGLTLVVGASALLVELQTDLNLIWDIKVQPKKGVWGFIQTQATPFIMIIFVGVIIIVTLTLSTALSAFNQTLYEIAPWVRTLSYWLEFGVSLLAMTFSFAMIFKFFPLVQLDWRDVWVGGLVTAVLFSIGKYAISWYLTTTGAGSAYGASGSLVVLLMFAFYSAQIFLLGAEFTQVWARTFGTRQRENNLLDQPYAWRGTVESDKSLKP